MSKMWNNNRLKLVILFVLFLNWWKSVDDIGTEQNMADSKLMFALLVHLLSLRD